MDRPADTSRATILITTKDRKQVLVRAIESVLVQSVPLELLVVDDGSTDGTADMVRERFPKARLIRNEEPLGIIAARNMAAREATTDILFTLDDDAVFSDSLVAECAIKDLQHERVGAVAIPLVNHIDGRRQVVDPIVDNIEARQQDDFLCAFPYRGGANALRRSLFLELGGYQGAGRQAEEHTYSIRMLNSGYVVRVASHGHVDHYPNALQRDMGVVAMYDLQNNMLFTWLYVPSPQLLIHMPSMVLRRLFRGLRRRQAWYEMRGCVRGCAAIWAARNERRPVSSAVYNLMRDLITNRTLPLSKVEPRLPPRIEEKNTHCGSNDYQLG